MSPDRLEKIKQVLKSRQPDLTVLMEDVHKPRNMAAIARTCDAVGIPVIHQVSPIPRRHFLNAKAAGGCKKWIETITHPSLDAAYQSLRDQGFKILAAHFSDKAVNFRHIDYTKPTVIVVGAELEGLSEEAAEKADGSIVIPMMGMSQSLNVSVATALILFEAQRQREEKGMYNNDLPEDSEIRIPLDWAYPNTAKKYRSNHLPLPELDKEGNFIDD